MPPQYTLPPDTRSIGSGNPPADMNAVVDAVTAMGAGLNVLNAAFAGGADPAGVNDSAAALQAAVNALPASGGTIWIPPGAYKATSTVTITGKYVTIRGSGRWATAWNYTGSGDAFRVFNTDTTGLITGGGLYDFTIDGSGAGAGACGLHMGDMRATELRIAVQNFSGTGSVNVLFDNQYCWMEECHGYLWLINGTRNLVFSVSEPAGGSYTATNASPAVFTCASPTFANGIQVVLSGGTPPTGFTNGTGYFVVNASGNTFQLSATSGGAAINSTSTGNGTVTQATSTNSFGYSDFQVEMLSRVGQDGLVIQNGAFLYNSKLAMRANFQGSASPQSNAVVRITGTTPVGHLNGGGPAKITSCHLDVQAELNPTGGGSNAPQTIVWGNLSGNLLLGCYGILDFAQGSIGFATSNWTPAGGVGAFTFTGVIRGDANLGGGGNFYSPTVVGPVIYGKSLLNNTNGNTQVNYGDFFSLTLTQSITVNLNPSAASTQAGAQRKTIVLKQAASGGPFTVTWPNTGSPSISNCTVVW